MHVGFSIRIFARLNECEKIDQDLLKDKEWNRNIIQIVLEKNSGEIWKMSYCAWKKLQLFTYTEDDMEHTRI